MKKEIKKLKFEKVFKSYKKLDDIDKNLFLEKLNDEITIELGDEDELKMEYEYLDLLRTRTDIAQKVMNIKNEDGKSFFNVDWVAKYIFQFTEEDIKELKVINKDIKKSKKSSK